MEQYDHMAGMWLVGEDLPQEGNRVTLNRDVRDQFGQPIPNVHVDDHPNDTAMREHAYAAGESVYGAVGALRTFRVPPYPTTHNLGTAIGSAIDRFGGQGMTALRAYWAAAVLYNGLARYDEAASAVGVPPRMPSQSIPSW